MLNLKLPPAHSIRANWMPLNYYPLIGSNNCLTVAVIVFSENGEKCLVEANGLDRLRCLYGPSADGHLAFLRIAVDTLRSRLEDLQLKTVSEFDLGSSLIFGEVRVGSGHSLSEIGRNWLKKISLIHGETLDSFELSLVAQSYSVSDEDEGGLAGAATEKRLLTNLRAEVQSMAPKLVSNFNKTFQPKNRILPVKLGYSGDHLVADFDRVAPKGLGPSLSRIRSKLWVLAEHRDQTRHQSYRAHEMLVVPSERYQPLQSGRDADTFEKACSDIEQEADRRDIRFRRFANSHEAAQHIFRTENATRAPIPLM